MIGRCVANRPSIYQPLKGDVNDYSVNVYSVTNNNVTTATGIFGESNGSYEWNSNTDYLEINSSAKTHLEGSALENITMTMDIAIVDNTLFTPIGYGIYGTNIANRVIAHAYRGNDATDVIRNFIYPTTVPIIFDYANTPTNNVWYHWSFTNKSTENYIYVNGVKVATNTTFYINSKTSTEPLRVGQQLGGLNAGRNKCANLRLYNTQLSDGKIKILSQEKGRIRA